jgi:hypothetical protein
VLSAPSKRPRPDDFKGFRYLVVVTKGNIYEFFRLSRKQVVWQMTCVNQSTEKLKKIARIVCGNHAMGIVQGDFDTYGSPELYMSAIRTNAGRMSSRMSTWDDNLDVIRRTHVTCKHCATQSMIPGKHAKHKMPGFACSTCGKYNSGHFSSDPWPPRAL